MLYYALGVVAAVTAVAVLILLRRVAALRASERLHRTLVHSAPDEPDLRTPSGRRLAY